ncbi:MAG: TrkA family potassium uptake protein [Anaerolineae bacterium]
MFVIIVGGGQVGSNLASLLLAAGHKVHVVDDRKEVLAKIHRELPTECIFEGDGADMQLLRLAGIEHAEVLAAVAREDEANLMVAHLARFEFHVPRIIARVNNPKNAWLFTPDMGVDVAINQADMMAHLIAEEMSLGDMMTLLKLRKGQYSLVEEKVHPTAVAVGKAIRDLKLPTECVLAAVIRKGELIIPRGDVVLQAADEILAVVHSTEVNALAQLLARTD